MLHRVSPAWIRAAVWLTGFWLATVLLVIIARGVITWKKPCPDYTCFWAAGKILASGQNPYDFELQAKVQHEYGWDKDTDGLGFFAFLPYRFPPSIVGPIWVLLVPLGFHTARITWLVINVELLIITGFMLSRAVDGVVRWIPMVVVPAFACSVLAVLVGQVSPLILFLIVVAWRLMQSDWDRSAGWVLAWMNIKPQLTIILLIAILLWCARQRRTRVIEGFVTGLVLLLAVSTWLVPTWPRDMFRSSSETPLVTVDYPWVGTTWLLVLRSIGLGGWILWAGYLAAVLPLGWLVLRTAMDRTSALSDVFALSILVAYFVAPYARLYDMGVLVIPLLVLISGRLHQAWTGALLLTVVALPYLQFIYGQPPGNFAPHVRFFWIPLLIAATWLATRTRLSNVRV